MARHDDDNGPMGTFAILTGVVWLAVILLNVRKKEK